MKERPIMLSGAMVRAILNGRKTQTRRVVKPRHPLSHIGPSGTLDDPSEWGYFFDGPDHNGYMVIGRGHDERHDHGRISIPCPYGSPGDRLWVRETWCLANPDHAEVDRAGLPRGPRGEVCYYAASDPDVEGDNGKSPWRPSIHMPRWASRITLEVLSVRVQRLQDISEYDAGQEGVDELDGEIDDIDIRRMAKAIGDMAENSRTWFACLWDSINGKRATWASNPWVWAIEFTMVNVDGEDKP